jgi:5-methylcytosine-specific restriction endonuclease McrA
MVSLEIEHVTPLAAGGTNDESNLWLACPICNGHKSSKTTGFEPGSRFPYSTHEHKTGTSTSPGPMTGCESSG